MIISKIYLKTEEIKKDLDMKIDKQEIIARYKKDVRNTFRVVDSDYIQDIYDCYIDRQTLQATSLLSDYPVLYRKKSDREIVITDLTKANQCQICLNLGQYLFKSFVA